MLSTASLRAVLLFITFHLLVDTGNLIAQTQSEKLTIADVIGGFSYYKYYPSGNHLSLEDMYEFLIQSNTFNSDHYHQESMGNFNIYEEGYDLKTPWIRSFIFGSTLQTDTNFQLVIEEVYDQYGNYEKLDTVLLRSRFYSTYDEDRVYSHHDSIIHFGMYLLKSIEVMGSDRTDCYCNQNRFLGFFPDRTYVQHFTNFEIKCEHIDYNKHRDGVCGGNTYLTPSGDYHVSKNRYLYLLSKQKGLVGRLKIEKADEDQLVLINDGGVIFRYLLIKD